MGSMQSQLRKYKESASDIHSLRADMQSVSNILDRKVKECDAFSVRSASQLAEIKRLLGVFQDLRESELDLKLTLEMFRRESIDSRDVMDAREAEYRAWAHVQSLKSSLDEHNLELRVKKANEAEARSQQKLAAGEAEIADMRQKLEDSKRKMCDLSDVLKSKNKQNENYLSEIESIGQAYDDMQTQNQHLLQQITERDDYNIKLVLEGVRARQKQDSLLMEKRVIEQGDDLGLKPAVTEAALQLILKKFFGIILDLPSVNRRLSDVMSMLSSKQPSCPQLYLYSSADTVIPADYVESFVEAQRRDGHDVRACNFVSSPHVDHFRNDPKLYTSQLSQFLEESVLSHCKSH